MTRVSTAFAVITQHEEPANTFLIMYCRCRGSTSQCRLHERSLSLRIQAWFRFFCSIRKASFNLEPSAYLRLREEFLLNQTSRCLTVPKVHLSVSEINMFLSSEFAAGIFFVVATLHLLQNTISCIPWYWAPDETCPVSCLACRCWAF